MSQADTIFLPLGGTGEIGMNCNLYGVATPEGYDWIMVDLGVVFSKGASALAGIDLIMPDTSFIEKAGNLKALLLTHGHEDHIGAVAHLWHRLQCPIYATPFTAELVQHKLREQGLCDTAPLHIIDMDAHLEIGAFTIDYITLTHSIAEPSALAIRASNENGTTNILHTGDWKIDPDPVIGANIQEKRLTEFGDEGIDAIICDSTNAMVSGRSGSEGKVGENLTALIGQCKNQVVVTSFASNVARLASVIKAADAHGRVVCLAGHGMRKIVAAAKKTGYLKGLPAFIEEENINSVPREKRLLLCTGSQGEARAALARITRGDHPHLSLKKGDHVIFSSRIIPGNEVEIGALHNQLIERGIEVIVPRGNDIHVSGHPCEEELRDMYRWARPKLAIPVHGEARHIKAHAALAKSLGVAQTLELNNGDVVQISPTPKVIDRVESGRLYLDGDILVSGDDEALHERQTLADKGLVIISVPINTAQCLAGDIDIALYGVPADNDLYDMIDDAIDRALPSNGKIKQKATRKDITTHVKSAVYNYWGKRAQIDVRFISCL